MVPVWFTWFFIIGAAVNVLLLINEDKLLRMEAEYDKRKAKRRVRRMEFLKKKDKQTALDMVRELISANQQLRTENRYLRQCNVKLTEQNKKLLTENFELSHPTVPKGEDDNLPGWFFYAAMRSQGDGVMDCARTFK